MSNKLKDWSTTAADNNATPPEGWPEGMAPSKVNDTARQNMKYLREWYEDSQWIRYAHTISASTSTTVTISGDVTDVYVEDRAVRFDEDDSRVGFVASATYTAPNTVVTIAGHTVSSPTIIEAAAVKDETCLPRDVVGDRARTLIGYPPGFIYGLDLSVAADTDHDITIAAGSCRNDADTGNIDLLSALTKQLDAAWEAGTDAGGLPTGVTLVGDEWLYFFVIADGDGNVDAGFDDNASATNLLSDSGYTSYRHVGSVFINASSDIFTDAIVNNKDIGKGLTTFKIINSLTLPACPLADVYTSIELVGAGGAGDSSQTGSDGGSTSIPGFTALGGWSGTNGGLGGTISASGDSDYIEFARAGQRGGAALGGGDGGRGGEAGHIAPSYSSGAASGPGYDLFYPLITGGNHSSSMDGNNGGGGGGNSSLFVAGGGGGYLRVRNYPAQSLVFTIGAGGTNDFAGTGGDGFALVRI